MEVLEMKFTCKNMHIIVCVLQFTVYIFFILEATVKSTCFFFCLTYDL